MGKTKLAIASRPCGLLRMASLLCARLAKLTSHFRRLGGENIESRYKSFFHGEREFSFVETPTFRCSLRRPRPFMCICEPQVDGVDDGEINGDVRGYFEQEVKEEYGDYQLDEFQIAHDPTLVDEVGVDVKADEFIRRFRQQILLQRQISMLQHTEMFSS